MVSLTEGICRAYGAEGKIDFIYGTPPLVNDRKEALFVESVIRRSFGDEVCTLVEPVMGGEDFSYYLQKKPGAFIFVGMGGEKSRYPHHHPRFDLDEEVFPDAIALFIEIIKNYQQGRTKG